MDLRGFRALKVQVECRGFKVRWVHREASVQLDLRDCKGFKVRRVHREASVQAVLEEAAEPPVHQAQQVPPV